MTKAALNCIKRFISMLDIPSKQESNHAYQKILGTINNDMQTYKQLMVNSIEELEVTLACLGLDHVPDSIAPIVLLDFWCVLMPNLVENLRSSHPCFKLTAEQKQLFKAAYPEITRLYPVEHLLKVVGSSVPKDEWLQRLEAADRRVKELNQVYEALGINIFKQQTADHVFLDDDFWMKARISSF